MTAAAILNAVRILTQLERFRSANGDDEQRQYLDGALDPLYRLGELREGDGRAAQGYRNIAHNCDAGQTTEGLVRARNTRTHGLTRAVAPQNRGLFPGARTFPGPETFPGATLLWLHVAEMDPAVAAHVQEDTKTYPFYAAKVAGQPVLDTLLVAGHSLAEPAQLGPL